MDKKINHQPVTNLNHQFLHGRKNLLTFLEKHNVS